MLSRLSFLHSKKTLEIHLLCDCFWDRSCFRVRLGFFDKDLCEALLDNVQLGSKDSRAALLEQISINEPLRCCRSARLPLKELHSVVTESTQRRETRGSRGDGHADLGQLHARFHVSLHRNRSENSRGAKRTKTSKQLPKQVMQGTYYGLSSLACAGPGD